MNNELNEKLEAVRKTAEEKAEEIREVVEEVKLEAAEKFEEAGSLSEEVKEKLDKTLAALDETLKQDKVENPESGIQLTLKPSDAVLAARREVKEKYGEKDDKTVELKE